MDDKIPKNITEAPWEHQQQELPIIHKYADNLDWAERTLCATLEDLRKIIIPFLKSKQDLPSHSLNITMSLINEIQVYANRMEAALEDKKAHRNLKKDHKKLTKEKESLKEEIKDLEKKKETLDSPLIDAVSKVTLPEISIDNPWWRYGI